MKKTHYFKDVIKQALWGFFDHLFKIIFISILWFLFNIPVFYTIYVLLYSKFNNPILYIFLINIVLFSPVSVGASYYILQIASKYASSKMFTLFPQFTTNDNIRINIFFKGIFKYFFKSIILVLINSFIFILLYFNFFIYLKYLTVKTPVLGFILLGITLWAGLLIYLMQVYIIPLLLTRKISLFKIIYQSFLLVTDNIIFTMAISIMITSLFIIIGFTVVGIALLLYGTISLMQILACLNIYQQYDTTMEIKKEIRTLKNIIKPLN